MDKFQELLNDDSWFESKKVWSTLLNDYLEWCDYISQLVEKLNNNAG